ncbi:MAG: M16 family metallopeptidase [Flavobacterium sp.]|jgi:zinc protease
MKKTVMAFCSFLMLGNVANAQKITFEEYDLANGLHVILHQDKSTPTVKVEVMYHVGSKDDPKGNTGFAHFFEHLLFEGTKNIGRGEFFKIVTANGGSNNANTSYDRTTYFEVFPSNGLQLGLWMEAERMLHPVINQIGVDTQNGVIKEEMKQTADNRPYGSFLSEVTRNLFPTYTYKHRIIGSAEDLDNSKLDDFMAFHKKFYVPNNAVLIVAGDFNNADAKKWIEDYFGSIPRGADIVRTPINEAPITQQINATYEDANITIPAAIVAYRTPKFGTRDARVLDLISTLLSDGKSSRMYKKIVDDKKMAMQVGAMNYTLEDAGMYIIYGLPLTGFTTSEIMKECDDEIVKLQNELISEREFQKLKNKVEADFVRKISSPEGVASELVENYTYLKDANQINKELDIYRSITREEIKEIANKYLKPNQRLYLDYIPKKDKEEPKAPKGDIQKKTTDSKY